MNYRILVNDRKQITAKMKELTGEKPEYTGMPRCAYILRGIVIERNGEVNTEEDADLELVGQLIGLGMIASPNGAGVQAPAPAAEDTAAEETGGETTEGHQEMAVGEQAAQGNISEGEASEKGTEEAAETAADPDEEDTGEEAETGTEVTEEDDGTQDETSGEDGDPYADLEEQEIRAAKVSISFPLEKHTPDSICNLVFTIYSKGGLISKATQGTFQASEALVEALQSGSIIRKEEVLEAIKSAGKDSLQGLTFEDGKVTFDGFPATDDPDVRKAWIELSTAINKTAIRQNHVRPKKTDESNERFAFRTWLTRLGMNGADLKAERNILYRHLSGHTAFRTAEDQERWTKRQNEKRDAFRKLKEAALEEEMAESTEAAE